MMVLWPALVRHFGGYPLPDSFLDTLPRLPIDLEDQDPGDITEMQVKLLSLHWEMFVKEEPHRRRMKTTTSATVQPLVSNLPNVAAAELRSAIDWNGLSPAELAQCMYYVYASRLRLIQESKQRKSKPKASGTEFLHATGADAMHTWGIFLVLGLALVPLCAHGINRSLTSHRKSKIAAKALEKRRKAASRGTSTSADACSRHKKSSPASCKAAVDAAVARGGGSTRKPPIPKAPVAPQSAVGRKSRRRSKRPSDAEHKHDRFKGQDLLAVHSMPETTEHDWSKIDVATMVEDWDDAKRIWVWKTIIQKRLDDEATEQRAQLVEAVTCARQALVAAMNSMEAALPSRLASTVTRHGLATTPTEAVGQEDAEAMAPRDLTGALLDPPCSVKEHLLSKATAEQQVPTMAPVAKARVETKLECAAPTPFLGSAVQTAKKPAVAGSLAAKDGAAASTRDGEGKAKPGKAPEASDKAGGSAPLTKPAATWTASKLGSHVGSSNSKGKAPAFASHSRDVSATEKVSTEDMWTASTLHGASSDSNSNRSNEKAAAASADVPTSKTSAAGATTTFSTAPRQRQPARPAAGADSAAHRRTKALAQPPVQAASTITPRSTAASNSIEAKPSASSKNSSTRPATYHEGRKNTPPSAASLPNKTNRNAAASITPTALQHMTHNPLVGHAPNSTTHARPGTLLAPHDAAPYSSQQHTFAPGLGEHVIHHVDGSGNIVLITHAGTPMPNPGFDHFGPHLMPAMDPGLVLGPGMVFVDAHGVPIQQPTGPQMYSPTPDWNMMLPMHPPGMFMDQQNVMMYGNLDGPQMSFHPDMMQMHGGHMHPESHPFHHATHQGASMHS